MLLFFGGTILLVVILRWCPVYFTPLMFIRCAQQMKHGEKIRMRHHWMPIEEMSPNLPIAVMASEDQRFLEHRGFDFGEIDKAIKERQSGKRKRGASTISQQTAKNVFLWPKASWFRKGFEVYFTALIELIWGKDRIRRYISIPSRWEMASMGPKPWRNSTSVIRQKTYRVPIVHSLPLRSPIRFSIVRRIPRAICYVGKHGF